MLTFFNARFRKKSLALLLFSITMSTFILVNIVQVYNFVKSSKPFLDPHQWKLSQDLKPYFSPAMTPQEKDNLLELLGKFDEIFRQEKLTYFMYGGTLLGSYRYLGVIPWDDDIDILVNITEIEHVRRILSNQGPRYKLYTGFQTWKFYLDSPEVKPKIWWEKFARWRWPFVDIFFFEENATHVWDADRRYKDVYIYKKADVFPLVRRPFNRLWLNAPKHSKRVLEAHYNTQVCVSTDIDHKTEFPHYLFHNWARVNCSELHKQYPFVHRTTKEDGTVLEVLKHMNGTKLREFHAQTL